MKTITVWQPWASLIACGAKHYETRSWKTNYRGPIAIHAGKGDTRGVFALLPLQTREAIRNALMQYKLPIGAIIATADLVDCIRVSHPIFHYDHRVVAVALENGEEISGNEYVFGDYTPERYAWKLENIKMLNVPIPAKGKQGLWNWECGIGKADW